MPKRQFDATAALKAVDEADKPELEALDAEVTILIGRIIALVRAVHDRAAADDDQSVGEQIVNARKARDELQAMLAATTGGTSSGTTTLTNEQKTLLELLSAGDIRLIQVDDPDNPGTKVPAVRDNRDRLRSGRTRGQAPSPSTSQPPAVTSTPAPTPNPTPPASPATNPGTSDQGTTTPPPANPSTPATTTPATTGPQPVTAPASSTSQPPAVTSTPAPTPNPTPPASPATNPGTSDQGTTTPRPAPKKGLLDGLTHLFEREPKSPKPTTH